MRRRKKGTTSFFSHWLFVADLGRESKRKRVEGRDLSTISNYLFYHCLARGERGEDILGGKKEKKKEGSNEELKVFNSLNNLTLSVLREPGQERKEGGKKKQGEKRKESKGIP